MKKLYLEFLLVFLLIIISFGMIFDMLGLNHETRSVSVFGVNKGEYIKWVDFNVPLEVLSKAYKHDIESYGKDVELNWVELIAYTAAKTWGTFENNPLEEMSLLVEKLNSGENIHDITENLELYPYYIEAYRAVLSGFVGEYEIIDGDRVIRKYGLKAFSPIARGYGFSHYDDFGNARSYGYKRKHLGNDLIGGVGTPIVSVEDGYIEALGWNQYGGWRIGIRSLDGKRYYYYAHLRKDHPFVKTLKEGDRVQAGEVIGYLGMTGYSRKENVNNIQMPHLHFGLQLIFDESQKDGVNQIWIDVYTLIRFLEKNRMPVHKGTDGDFESSFKFNSIIVD